MLAFEKKDLEDLLFFGCEDNDADALRDILAAVYICLRFWNIA